MKNMKEEEAKIAKFHHQFYKTRTNHNTAQIIE